MRITQILLAVLYNMCTRAKETDQSPHGLRFVQASVVLDTGAPVALLRFHSRIERAA